MCICVWAGVGYNKDLKRPLKYSPCVDFTSGRRGFTQSKTVREESSLLTIETSPFQSLNKTLKRVN